MSHCCNSGTGCVKFRIGGGCDCACDVCMAPYVHKDTYPVHLIATLRADLAASQREVERLRKLFDDAGQGEHNVLALVDHYQDAAIKADSDRDAFRDLLTIARRFVEELAKAMPDSEAAALLDEIDDNLTAGAASSAEDDRPYVCAGCHAVAPERCLPGCIEAEIEADLAAREYDPADEDEATP